MLSVNIYRGCYQDVSKIDVYCKLSQLYDVEDFTFS